jgi:hypothetical protein
MDSVHKADLVNGIIPRRPCLQLGDITTEELKCKMKFSAAKMAESSPLLAAAPAIIVIKSDVNSDMDVAEGYGGTQPYRCVIGPKNLYFNHCML